MAEPPLSREQDVGGVYRDILLWSTELLRWQQELLRRVLNETVLSAEAIDELAAASVREAEQQPSPYPAFSEADLPSAASAPEGLVLESVGDLRNVNALRSGQTLTFGPELTVVYGDNASGKSGYARVMKKVYRARAVDDILGDVRADQPSIEPATAHFVVRDAQGTAIGVHWQDGQPAMGTGRFAVLDAACSSLYMRGGALAYGPAGLDLPQRFAEELDRVKKRLTALAAAAKPDKSPLLHVASESSAGQFVQRLSSATTEAEVREFTTWTAEAEQELVGVRRSLTAADAQSLSARRVQLNARVSALGSITSRLSVWCTNLDAPYIASIQERLMVLEEATRAVEAVETVADPAVPADLSRGQVWLTLLHAASRFVEGVNQDEHAVGAMSVDGKCVLCWQPIHGESEARLDRFRQHLTGTALSNKRMAEDRLAELVDGIRTIPSVGTPEVSAVIADERITDLVGALRDEMTQRRDAVLEHLDDGRSLPSFEPLDRVALEALLRLQALTQAEVESLPPSDSEAQAARVAMRQREVELQAQKELSEVSQVVRAFIAGTIEQQRLQNAAGLINTRAVSAKATELHAKHLTDKYQELFNEELKELRFRRRQPELAHKTSKARVEVTPLVSADLKHVPPERVFSEGERTAIALACFLAEVRLGGDPVGLVFDDPVSSLDHNVREHVARRLVAAAKNRQVIVFTHDLAFLADLREQARKIQNVECEFRTLVATDYDAGFVEPEAPFGARPVKKRIGALREMIVDAERAAKDGDMASLRAHGKDFYESLRSTWERFIEERLFASVVQRLERNVTPGALRRVRYTPDLGELVHEGWRRCSAALEAHDHAPAQGGQSYSVEGMRADLEQLVSAEKAAPA